MRMNYYFYYNIEINAIFMLWPVVKYLAIKKNLKTLVNALCIL